MIWLSSAPNEDDLEPLFGGLAKRYPIPYGDFNFQGLWTDGEPIWIWGERKRLRDLITCVMSSGRFLRQIQDAHTAGFRFKFCVIEALFRKGDNGLLEYRNGGGWKVLHLDPRNPDSPTVSYNQVADFLNQIDYYCGVRVRVTASPVATVAAVTDLYRLFSKPPEDHSSLKQFEEHTDAGAAYLSKPSLVRRLVKEFDGIGWDKSRGFDRTYPHAVDFFRDVVDGNQKGLTQVDGVGKTLAKRIIDSARGE